MFDNFNFRHSIALKNLDQYSTMRVNVDLAILFYMIKFFQPRSILEIGVYEGLTLGLMLEAAPAQCVLTGIDIHTIVGDLFHTHYSAMSENVKIIKISSDDFESTQGYDFINVDGDHNMPRQYTDIAKSAAMLNANGILMVDDIDMPGVIEAVDCFIEQQSDIVPFLMTTQTMFFHRPQYHQAGEFLDALSEKFTDFCEIKMQDYKSHYVPRIFCVPAIIKHNDIFKLICDKYSI